MAGLIGNLAPQRGLSRSELLRARAPDYPPGREMNGLLDSLSSLNAAMGGPVGARTRQADEAQQARLASGERSPTPITEDSTWLADDVAGGFIGPLGAAGIFAGVGAKTANRGALEVAERMTKEGADPRAIFKETNWFKAPWDGQWRWEIDDSGARMNKRAFEPDTSSAAGQESRQGIFRTIPERQAFTHPKLFDAYPDMRKMRTRGVVGDGGSGDGAYIHSSDSIDFDARSFDDARSIGLHELNHGVQAREGFARGGSPELEISGFQMAPQDLERANSYIYEMLDLERAAKQVEAGKPVGDVIKNFPAMFGKQLSENAEALLKNGMSSTEANQLWKKKRAYLDDYNRMLGRGYDSYKRLAGEAEARAVQARADMTPEQRRATFPLDTIAADVPLDELIVRQDGSGVQASELPMDQASRMARAKEMGLDVPVYHGTTAENLDKFEVGRESVNSTTFGDMPTTRHAVFVSDNKDFSKQYGDNIHELVISNNIGDFDQMKGRFIDSIDPFEDRDMWMSARYAAEPWMFFDEELGARFKKFAQDEGYDGVRFKEWTDSIDGGADEVEGTTTAVFDPANIRSVHAKFDPAKRDSADLLAGVAGGVGLLGALNPRQENR